MVMFYFYKSEEIKQDRQTNANRMFSKEKINSLIRKQESRLLKTKPLTPKEKSLLLK